MFEGIKSGREDLNLRPPAPEAGALAGLRYAPFFTVLPLSIHYQTGSTLLAAPTRGEIGAVRRPNPTRTQ